MDGITLGLSGIGAFIAPKVYDDLFRPTIKMFGDEISKKLCKAFFDERKDYENPVISKRFELLLNDVSRHLSSRLVNVELKDITNQAPDYIIIPASSAWEYSINSPDLRSLYANLLVSAIIEQQKNLVHPAFVEIIRQMHPNEVLVFKELTKCKIVPTLEIKLNEKVVHNVFINGVSFGSGVEKNIDGKILFKNLAILKCMNDESTTSLYLSNLKRLGLIDINFGFGDLDENIYAPLKQLPIIKTFQESYENTSLPSGKPSQITLTHGTITLSPFGRNFVMVCLPELQP